MNTSFIHLLILVLLIGCGTTTPAASVSNTPPGRIWSMMKRATAQPKGHPIAAPPGHSASNNAAGLDLGVGASSIVRQEI